MSGLSDWLDNANTALRGNSKPSVAQSLGAAALPRTHFLYNRANTTGSQPFVQSNIYDDNGNLISQGAGVYQDPGQTAALARDAAGMQPTLPPMGLGDVAGEFAGRFADEADLSKYALPAMLLGMVRYRKPGVSAAARAEAEAYHALPAVDQILSRNTVFHATSPDVAEQILKSGGIRPGAIFSPDPGVSVSRVPRVASKAEKAVSFVIPGQNMPKSRPFAEPGYQKTIEDLVTNPEFKQLTADKEAAWQQLLGMKQGHPGFADQLKKVQDLQAKHYAAIENPEQFYSTEMVPNRQYEFEDRTFNQPIPAQNITEMWVDRAALQNHIGPNESLFDHLRKLHDLADKHNLNFRVFPTGRDMHAGRVTQEMLPPKPALPIRGPSELQTTGHYPAGMTVDLPPVPNESLNKWLDKFLAAPKEWLGE